jgi:Icc-related predicted phosphoesterase
MKIWHISDTHTYHNQLTIPEGVAIVIFSGDCSNPRDPYHNEPEVRGFIDWFSALPIPHKVFVAGNHDTSIEIGFVTKADFEDKGIHYLENTHVTIEGFKIFGSPLTPSFGQGWAFNKERHKLDRIWNKVIDIDTDIIVTHGPPKGMLDMGIDRQNIMEFCGCKSLLNVVKVINPKLMLFGHIHNCKDISNSGTKTVSGLDTLFSNGSVVTDGKFGRLSSNGNILEIKQKL